jgi:hypothetical protein
MLVARSASVRPRCDTDWPRRHTDANPGALLGNKGEIRRETDSLLEGSGLELPVPGYGKLCQTSILFVFFPGGGGCYTQRYRSRSARHCTEPRWADLTARLEAAPR